MNNFWTRTLTGAVFVGVILGAIYLGEWTFSFLLLAINALCILEYVSLFRERGLEPSVPLLITCSVSVLGLVLLSPAVFDYASPVLPGWHTTLFSFAGMARTMLFIFCIMLVPLIGELFRQKPDPFIRGAIGLAGILYITIPIALFSKLPTFESLYNPHIAASIFYLVWASDTFAYLTGRAFGRRPLFPSVSPKKTWEGSIGGTLGAIGISVLLFYTIGIFTLPVWIGLAMVIVVFGTLGDLIESMMKRSLGLKDSGNILPGHGGVLDRFDAFLFAVPFAAAYIWMVG